MYRHQKEKPNPAFEGMSLGDIMKFGEEMQGNNKKNEEQKKATFEKLLKENEFVSPAKNTPTIIMGYANPAKNLQDKIDFLEREKAELMEALEDLYADCELNNECADAPNMPAMKINEEVMEKAYTVLKKYV